jgi:hypothetical protein
MHPLLIYPPLHHFHNHGLAISFHFIWKEIFEEYFSPRLSSKSPSPQRDGALKERERERNIEKREEGKRKAPRISTNKMGKSIFWEDKNISTSKYFYMSPFSPPPSYHFQNLSKIIWESFVALFGPSFNLAISMTWVVSFVFTHELHIFTF